MLRFHCFSCFLVFCPHISSLFPLKTFGKSPIFSSISELVEVHCSKPPATPRSSLKDPSMALPTITPELASQMVDKVRYRWVHGKNSYWISMRRSALLGGGWKNIFYFHPYLRKIPILNMFQMGWNHQPILLLGFSWNAYKTPGITR